VAAVVVHQAPAAFAPAAMAHLVVDHSAVLAAFRQLLRPHLAAVTSRTHFLHLLIVVLLAVVAGVRPPLQTPATPDQAVPVQVAVVERPVVLERLVVLVDLAVVVVVECAAALADLAAVVVVVARLLAAVLAATAAAAALKVAALLVLAVLVPLFSTGRRATNAAARMGRERRCSRLH
jgi:hypothetical protein